MELLDKSGTNIGVDLGKPAFKSTLTSKKIKKTLSSLPIRTFL